MTDSSASPRVHICVDMEGVAGISTVNQCARGSDDYPYYRRLMTAEANAAAVGAFDAGAADVLVSDGHGDMANLVPDMFDTRVRALTGSPKPGSMMAGIDGTFDVCFFVGFHARAGAEAAVRDHTINGATVHAVMVNGREWSESDINAAHAGSLGVPLGLVTGDDKICAHVNEHQPWARTVKVKDAVANAASASVHPQRACELIRAAAADAVRERDSFQLFAPEPPYDLEIAFHLSAAADVAAEVPGAERTGGRTVAYHAADMRTLQRAIRSLIVMGGTQSLRR